MMYYLKEGIKNVFRDRSLSIASISSVTASLFVLGLVLCIVLNINNITSHIKDTFNEMQIYITEETSQEDMDAIRSYLESKPGVNEVRFVSKDQAFEDFKKQHQDESYLFEGMENPLQDSYLVEIDASGNANLLRSELESMPGVDSIEYQQEIVDKLTSFNDKIAMSGFSLILILTLISLFVISTTIKITFYSRKEEIHIMKYMGATNWFVRWPFVFEGIFLGLLGAMLASVAIYYFYNFIYNSFISTSTLLGFSNYFLQTQDFIFNLVIIFAVMGIGIGTVGSVLSLRRYLKV